ncbi:MAG: SelB C-terminal domain-containing protein [Phenylobacterium sp.]|nr:SelB C-terminal domain-containing protein [Phenylobacterium sp.]
MLEPSGRRVHLRQLQVHGQAVAAARAGGRVAAALRGVAPEEVRVGDVLCTTGAFPSSQRIDAEVELTPDAARPLRSGDEVRVLWGARQDLARVRLIGAPALEPGGSGLAQLRFASPVPVHAGQRLLLRRPSPAATLGGGRVLDPVAPVLRSRTLEARRELLAVASEGRLEPIAEALARRDGGAVSATEAARLSRRPAEEVRSRLARTFVRLDEDLFAPESAVQSAMQAYLDRLGEAHHAHPMRAFVALGALRGGLSRTLSRELIVHVEGRLADSGEIRIERGQAALKGHDPFATLSPDQRARLGEIESTCREGGMTPPDVSVLAGEADSAALLGLLVESGRLVSLRNHALRQTLVFHPDALDAALRDLKAAFPPPAEFTTGEARAALSTSRKFIVPVLEFLDARGDTVRRGDLRQVLHPRNRFGPEPVPH